MNNNSYTPQDLQDNLAYLNITKGLIKNAIINKGQNIGPNDTFRSYANKITNIETGVGTIYNSVAEMEASTGHSINDLGIVYPLNFEGLYRYTGTNWIKLGGQSEELTSYIQLYNILGEPQTQYEGLGGTEAEITSILEDIVGEEV